MSGRRTSYFHNFLPLRSSFLLSFLALIFFWFLADTIVAQSVYVPLNHWAYELVERFEAKGFVRGALNGTKPYSREEMAGYLIQVEEQVTSGQIFLNKTETEQLAFLRTEFNEEFKALTGRNSGHYQTRIERLKNSRLLGSLLPGFVYRNNRNFFAIKDGPFNVFIDPIFYQQLLYANPDSVSGTERVFERTHGFTLHGTLGPNIGFFFDFRDTKEWGTRIYPDVFDISLEGLGFVNGYGTHIWHDETNAYFMFKLPYIQLMLGKDWNYWGPGFDGALSISNSATSFDQIKLQSKFWRLKFTWFLGFLRTFPRILAADGKTNPKSMVAHRLEIDVASWLDIGLYEMVVFGRRRFELAYLNPINFYRSAEHFLGDDDNATMGVDFEFLLIPNFKLYGELFIDDLSTSKLGGDFFGNKTGLLAGGLWVDAFRIENLDARLEYARTRPYLYTHRDEINKLTHFNTVIGHWIGPNAELVSMRLKYQFSRTLSVQSGFQRWRHGANTAEINYGGDINRSFVDSGLEEAQFLAGILERRHRFNFETRYELFRNFYLGLSLSRAVSKNVLTSTANRRNINRDEVFVNITLNR